MDKVVNPRSVLHALQPLGLGSAEVESLLSYFCRLAASHSTSTLSLSRAVAQRFEHDVEEQFDWFQRQISGIGDSALTWSSALSALTSIPRLDRLTFLPWRNVIAQGGLPIVSKGQFCPHCLAEDGVNGGTPYFRLAWESKAVTVCHTHHVRLEQHCPCCGKDNVRHAAALVVPGWCTKCGAFLGRDVSQASTDHAIEPVELWRARQMHEMLRVQQQFTHDPRRSALVDAIQHIIAEMDGGQGARFAKRVGISKGTVHYWLQSDKLPTLETSMQVASQSGIGVVQLLTGDTAHWKPPSQEPQLTLFKAQDRKRGPQREIDWGEVEQQLQNFLHEPNPVPVREVSKQLDIETRFLYLKCNQTARQIGQRWLTHQKHRRQVRLAKAMPYLEEAGRDVLKEGKALNLREVTTRVPAEVLSGVQGLYEVLRDVKSRVGPLRPREQRLH